MDSAPSNFFWMTSSTPDAPPDSSKGRQDVMQKVALRRRKEKRHHPNRRQLPVFIRSDNSNESSEKKNLGNSGCFKYEDRRPDAFEFDELHSQTSLTHLRVASPYPSVLLKCNLDFVDLASLASPEVGRFTGQWLIQRRRSIGQFLRGTIWSYCRYVPFYYARSVLVRNATDCVVARVRSLLTPDTTWESLALMSYSKALSNLQEVLNSTSPHLTAEVLCTTQILCIYELLNPSRENAWINHATGATSIIRLRGPGSYVSDFEKSLFLSHFGPIISEAILENQSCFLAQPAWVEVLRSIITDDPLVPARSTVLISLFIILATIPGLFRDFTKVICNHTDPPLHTMIQLISRARNLRLTLKTWYSSHIGIGAIPILAAGHDGIYCKILIAFYLCAIYSNRLNTCIHWTGTETSAIEEMEKETQRFAKAIVTLCEVEAYSALKNSLLSAQKLPIAEATIKTTEEWKQQWRCSRPGELFKMPERAFKHWCNLFGRKTA